MDVYAVAPTRRSSIGNPAAFHCSIPCRKTLIWVKPAARKVCAAVAERLSVRQTRIIGVRSSPPSTTLADLLTPPLGAHPFSTMRAAVRRQSSEEFDDCVAHGGQSWLRRRAVDSFFSASLLRD